MGGRPGLRLAIRRWEPRPAAALVLHGRLRKPSQGAQALPKGAIAVHVMLSRHVMQNVSFGSAILEMTWQRVSMDLALVTAPDRRIRSAPSQRVARGLTAPN